MPVIILVHVTLYLMGSFSIGCMEVRYSLLYYVLLVYVGYADLQQLTLDHNSVPPCMPYAHTLLIKVPYVCTLLIKACKRFLIYKITSSDNF